MAVHGTKIADGIMTIRVAKEGKEATNVFPIRRAKNGSEKNATKKPWSANPSFETCTKRSLMKKEAPSDDQRRWAAWTGGWVKKLQRAIQAARDRFRTRTCEGGSGKREKSLAASKGKKKRVREGPAWQGAEQGPDRGK